MKLKIGMPDANLPPNYLFAAVHNIGCAHLSTRVFVSALLSRGFVVRALPGSPKVGKGLSLRTMIWQTINASNSAMINYTSGYVVRPTAMPDYPPDVT